MSIFSDWGRIATIDAEPAFSFVSVSSDDLDSARFGILLDRIGLVFRRILLMVS